jgi:hypothetical protein
MLLKRWKKLFWGLFLLILATGAFAGSEVLRRLQKWSGLIGVEAEMGDAKISIPEEWLLKASRKESGGAVLLYGFIPSFSGPVTSSSSPFYTYEATQKGWTGRVTFYPLDKLTARRLIPPTERGGIAGGEKQCSTVALHGGGLRCQANGGAVYYFPFAKICVVIMPAGGEKIVEQYIKRK